MSLYFEDFAPGRVFELGSRVLSADDIVAFAEQWDPQRIHLEAEGLMASGWHTACVWMRLYVDAVLNQAAMLTAPGVEEIRWLVPVRPGMRLHGRTTILESWLSEGAPGRGTMRLRGELRDDGDQSVMTLLARGHARVREGARG